MAGDQTPEEYRAELLTELDLLEISQENNPSEYKAERIARLRERLGLK